MTVIPFTKMHGAANDYVVIDAIESPELVRIDWGPIAPRLCCRRTGIGADGVIIIQRPESGLDAEARMRIINADGSEGGMCGNGARCAVRHLVECGHIGIHPDAALNLVISDRILRASVSFDRTGGVAKVTVDMGPPSLDPRVIPFDPSALPAPVRRGAADEFTVGAFAGCFVSMGNPHLVCFAETPPESLDLERHGPLLERHRAFPERMNAHFVRIESDQHVRIRSWERGVGETMACGTGACAVVVAGVLSERLSRRCTVTTRGGPLSVEWREDSGSVLLGGPAERIFKGEWAVTGNESGVVSGGVSA